MAATSVLKSIQGSFDWQYQDTFTQTYQVTYDDVQTNPHIALALAQSASGSPVPSRGAISTNGLRALTISGEAVGGHRKLWNWVVQFGVPPEEADGGEGPVDPNPLLRPITYNIDYMDREYVIEQAKNLITLPHGDGKGGSRAAGTLGPIVNAAGKKPDYPQVDTERLEVLKIRRYYPTLAAIVTRNRTYKRTTNNDDVQGYTARQLRYLLTDSEGMQVINGYEVWPGTTSILAEDSTSLVLDNVGYDAWNDANQLVRLKNSAGEFRADPSNLTLDGKDGGDNSTTVIYRHLNEVAYAPLFT